MIWSVNSLNYVTEPVERTTTKKSSNEHILLTSLSGRLPATERFLCTSVFFRCTYAYNQRHEPLLSNPDTTDLSLSCVFSAGCRNWHQGLMAISILHLSVFTLPFKPGCLLALTGFQSYEQQMCRRLFHEMVWGTEADVPVGRSEETCSREQSWTQTQLSPQDMIESRSFQKILDTVLCLFLFLITPTERSTYLIFHLLPSLLPNTYLCHHSLCLCCLLSFPPTLLPSCFSYTLFPCTNHLSLQAPKTFPPNLPTWKQLQSPHILPFRKLWETSPCT